MKLTVGYTDGEEVSIEAEGETIQMELDYLRSIQKVVIQNLDAGDLGFKHITVTGKAAVDMLGQSRSRQALEDNTWYNMRGAKEAMPGRGLFIRNGQKVIRK